MLYNLCILEVVYMKYHAFNFLKKIYYVRTAGSENDLKAAEEIKAEVARLGGAAEFEEFMVDHSTINLAKLIVDGKEIECAGAGYSGVTPKEGVSGEFYYAEQLESIGLRSLKNKIILSATKRVPHDLYEKAVKDGALGFILITGSVYKKNSDVDLDPYLNRELDYTLGMIPTVMIRAKDAERMLEASPKEATIILDGVDDKIKTQNVVSTIEGTECKDEIITITAHYDSVSFSKGAYDNGTGVISLLHMYDYFMRNKPKRTLRFIWCGAEEMGLLGSKNYVKVHEEEVKNNVRLNINIDMVAATIGRDIACVTGDMDIVNYLKFMYKEEGFSLHVYQDVYSSDSTPFADSGVPAISFARLSGPNGATIHSHDDVIERLSEPNFLRTMDFIVKVIERWGNAYEFPIEKKIPEDVKKKIDKYYQRKKENK